MFYNILTSSYPHETIVNDEWTGTLQWNFSSCIYAFKNVITGILKGKHYFYRSPIWIYINFYAWNVCLTKLLTLKFQF